MVLIKKSKEIFGKKYYECKKACVRKKCSKYVLSHEEKKSFFQSQTKKIERKNIGLKIFLVNNFQLKENMLKKNICKNDI